MLDFCLKNTYNILIFLITQQLVQTLTTQRIYFVELCISPVTNYGEYYSFSFILCGRIFTKGRFCSNYNLRQKVV